MVFLYPMGEDTAALCSLGSLLPFRDLLLWLLVATGTLGSLQGRVWSARCLWPRGPPLPPGSQYRGFRRRMYRLPGEGAFSSSFGLDSCNFCPGLAAWPHQPEPLEASRARARARGSRYLPGTAVPAARSSRSDGGGASIKGGALPKVCNYCRSLPYER